MITYLEKLEENPKHKQVECLQGVLELIAKCESRVANQISYCRNVYGEVNGIVKGTQSNEDYIKKYRGIARRLRHYYNFKLAQLSKY